MGLGVFIFVSRKWDLLREGEGEGEGERERGGEGEEEEWIGYLCV